MKIQETVRKGGLRIITGKIPWSKRVYVLMKEKDNFERVIVLSGDGDFLPVLKYLQENNKKVLMLGRGGRTAKAIKQFAGSNFRDFEYLKNRLKME